MNASLDPFHTAAQGVQGDLAPLNKKTIICNYFSLSCSGDAEQKKALVTALVDAARQGHQVILAARDGVMEDVDKMMMSYRLKVIMGEDGLLPLLLHEDRLVTPFDQLNQYAHVFIDCDSSPQSVRHGTYLCVRDGFDPGALSRVLDAKPAGQNWVPVVR